MSAQLYELCVVEGKPGHDCMGGKGPLGSRVLPSRSPTLPCLHLKKRGKTQRTLSLCSGTQGLAGGCGGGHTAIGRYEGTPGQVPALSERSHLPRKELYISSQHYSRVQSLKSWPLEPDHPGFADLVCHGTAEGPWPSGRASVSLRFVIIQLSKPQG